MTTAQDIRDKTFEKSFNGYNMGQVDEFLDEMAADFSAMAKENAALKGKMRVLVEKVEEYRQTEDSMRLALLSAQKMSSQIESEAQAKADAILAEAKDSADRLTRRATDGIANEEAKLEEAKKATDKFFEHMRTVCEKQIEFYNKLSKMRLVGGDEPVAPAASAPAAAAPAVATAPQETPKETREQEVAETVKSIETSVEKAALDEPEQTLVVDTEIPEEEEEPTRRFGADAPAKKKRGFDDFRFDDDI
jgi:cell division initiation protein